MWIACYHLPCFGLACERKRQTELRGRPLALATSEGIVRIASEEAIRSGVRAGMAVSAARMFCPDLTVKPYDLPAYEEMAEAVWNRIALDSSFVEPLSPEVCFAMFSGPGAADLLLPSATDIHRIAETTVYTGMAASRFTARVAASRDPGNTPVVVAPGDEAEFLASCPIENLASFEMQGGSGKRQEILDTSALERLNRLGVRTFGDLLAVEERDLYRLFREKAFVLRRLARGLDREPVRALWPPMVIEHSVHQDEGIADTMMLDAAMRMCADHISASLKREQKHCRLLTLTIRYEARREARGERQEVHSQPPLIQCETERLRKAENDAAALFRAAQRLFNRIPPTSLPFTEVTLRASAIGIARGVQPALLDDNAFLRGLPHERQDRLDTAIRLVHERFGSDRVAPATSWQDRSRPFRLWTYPLSRRMSEPVEVITDSMGNPVRYARQGRWRDITQVQNRWSEASGRTGKLEEKMVFRVEAASSSFLELHRSGDRWCLAAIAD